MQLPFYVSGQRVRQTRAGTEIPSYVIILILLRGFLELCWNNNNNYVTEEFPCGKPMRQPQKSNTAGSSAGHMEWQPSVYFRACRCNRPDYPPPPNELYLGIFWTIPGYYLKYTLGYSLGAPRLYLRVYSGSSQSIPHKPRLYPIRYRVGYSLGYRSILWEILYMITINYKFKLIINSLGARVPHVSYVNIWMARVSLAS